jgi:hypothetical protein
MHLIRTGGKLGGVIDFDAVWNRIRSHAGETFKTKTGLAFSYHVPGAYLRVDRNGHEIERSLSRTNFEKAAAQLPAGGPGDLRDRQGASYTWGILMDPRIRRSDW